MKSKTKIIIALTAIMVAMASVSKGQNVNARSSEFEVDFSDPKKLVNTAVPIINWISPIPETSYVQEPKFKIKLEISCSTPIVGITINIKQGVIAEMRGSTTIKPKPEEELKTLLERNITLLDGENTIEVIVENRDGVKTMTYRKVQVGSSALEDMAKLERTDYALLFATDDYDNWSDLVNPIFDSRSIAEELKNVYKFNIEIVENTNQGDIVRKLREYSEKKYKPLDQLFIFFAGHGAYDQALGEGFVVLKESMLNDEGKVSYLSHNRLRSIINNIPCEHIFLAMDVCFGGTFDNALAGSRGAEEEVYREQNLVEFVANKLTYKTRKYLTSGGKTYVSDGIVGKHSPFAKNFIDALQSQGGNDGVLTLQELFGYVEKLKIQPRFGDFGDNAPGSDFLFVVK